MALSASTVWECRTTGADTNGGGFVTGASGTDWSQQAGAQYAVTDAVTNGTTTITSAAANFGTDVVGNILYISGGTAPITAGWYQITSRTNATTIVVDRSTGLTAGTGATLNIGGALLTIGQMFTNMSVSGMTGYIKSNGTSADYSLTAGLTKPTGDSKVIGYTTTRGDGGRPTIQAAGNITMLNHNATEIVNYQNLIFDGNRGGGFTVTVISAGARCVFTNCKIMNGTTGIAAGNVFMMRQCEVTNCGGTNAAIDCTGSGTYMLQECWVHANTTHGIRLVPGGNIIGSVIRCVIANNTGSGIAGMSAGAVVRDCVIYGNSTHGLTTGTTAINGFMDVSGNIFAKNGSFGINGSTGGYGTVLATPGFRNNAFWSNTSGSYTNILLDATNVSCSSTPFNGADANLANETSTDFSLNNTIGGGAGLRSTGVVGAISAITGATGYEDIGSFRHIDAATCRLAGMGGLAA